MKGCVITSDLEATFRMQGKRHISQDFINDKFASMPERLEAVIVGEGKIYRLRSKAKTPRLL